MNRDQAINLRTTKRVKTMVVQIAKAENRSVGNVIENLICDEHERRQTTTKKRRAAP